MEHKEYIPANYSTWMEYYRAKEHRAAVIARVKAFVWFSVSTLALVASYMAFAYVESMYWNGQL